MFEQELASIIMFVLKAADNPTPYYYNIPEDFLVPAAYFPTPEILTGGETFLTYRMEYDWYIHFFHKTTQEAHAVALKALTAIKESRNVIPLIDESGRNTGQGIRIADPSLRKADNGAVRLLIRFVSRRPYQRQSATKARKFKVVGWKIPNIQTEIQTALETAIEQYLNDKA